LNAVTAIVGTPPVITSKARTKEKVDHRFDDEALRRACPGFRFTPLEEGLQRTAAAQQATGARL
jgi:hypothetical protein